GTRAVDRDRRATVDAQIERPGAVDAVLDGQRVGAGGGHAEVVDDQEVAAGAADEAQLRPARAGRAAGHGGRAGERVTGGLRLDLGVRWRRTAARIRRREPQLVDAQLVRGG